MDSVFHDALVQWLIDGVSRAVWWQIVIFILVTTYFTIMSVTLYLHRSQAHLAVDFHPVVAHGFRFWLWLTTGMNTKEWVAVHRKHHAKCETEEDPHSPKTFGLWHVASQGTELYRAAAKVPVTLEKYGHLTPDDWIEQKLYHRFPWQGIGLLLIIEFCLFGVLGMTVWAVQMLWIPVLAAGVINGLGHARGYRNFAVPDCSHNVLPWGIVIGGEELHNNHHAYPASAKLSVRPWECDIGWLYIVVLECLGLATVRVNSLAPHVRFSRRERWDDHTIDAITRCRYQVLHWFDQTARKYRHDGVDWGEMRLRLIRLWSEPTPKPGQRQYYRSRTELLLELHHWRDIVKASGSKGLRLFASKLARLRLARP